MYINQPKRFDVQPDFGGIDAAQKRRAYSWLREVNAVALQHLCEIWTGPTRTFFAKEKGAGFPKFKNKHGKQSFRLNNQVVRFDWDKSRITLPKIALFEWSIIVP